MAYKYSHPYSDECDCHECIERFQSALVSRVIDVGKNEKKPKDNKTNHSIRGK